ncbi:hypothetical protein HMPREF7215_2818 [Pyramidobacter piscolens W5455]|uniref:Uncharacterized protein n=1 Tax=Pyramidobacter piscolens W5455 TaxID=352165 RepID=A0ABM9ZXJ4_9BACT|nr:hypothetical protein HMPREF7215_2818 [Pyramidobacter piscolens W5455]
MFLSSTFSLPWVIFVFVKKGRKPLLFSVETRMIMKINLPAGIYGRGLYGR